MQTCDRIPIVVTDFTASALKAALVEAKIRYVFLGKELGARPNNPNCYVEGKALYEKIAATEEFSDGIQRLITSKVLDNNDLPTSNAKHNRYCYYSKELV